MIPAAFAVLAFASLGFGQVSVDVGTQKTKSAQTQPSAPALAAITPAPQSAVAPKAQAQPPVLVPTPGQVALPHNLEGVVTLDEYKRYLSFNAKLRDDPSMKALYAQLMEHSQAIQKLQSQMNEARLKAQESDPEVKSVEERILKAMRANMGPPAGAPIAPTTR
jgi:hypothetical protein